MEGFVNRLVMFVVLALVQVLVLNYVWLFNVASGSMTLIGLLQPYLLELFAPRDSAENMEVSVATLGMGKFFTFSLILTLLYSLLFFALEAFNFFEWQMWLLRAVCSTALTMVLMLAIESVRSK